MLKYLIVNFFGHLNHLFSNVTRSIILSLTRGYFRKPLDWSFVAKYERKNCLVFCNICLFLADIALAKFGGNLKRKEKLNGRFGDVLSAMYFCGLYFEKISRKQ